MDNKQFYEAAIVSTPDAPPYSADLDEYIPYLPRLEPAESWTNFIRRIDSERDQADRGTRLTSAIYPADDSENDKRFNIPDACRDGFDTLLSACVQSWPATGKVPLDVMRRFAQLTPIWSSIRATHDENTAEWIWSRVRCLFAGAGYDNHAELAGIVLDQYPNCPLLPSESQVDWADKLTVAHRNCGYPVHLACLPWGGLTGTIHAIDKGLPLDDWQKALGLLHLLKHVRITDSGDLVVTYRSVCAQLANEGGSSVLGHLKATKLNLLQALGIPVADEKGMQHPLNAGLHWALNHLTANQLLRRTSPTRLPGMVLAGPWSTLVPNPNSRDSFVQHGLALDGVWQASNGRVEVCYGDDDDVMDYAWNVMDSNSVQHRDLKDDFVRILPKTYKPQLPSELFFPAFPNLELVGVKDLAAFKCLFDVPIIASLIRTEVPELLVEYPIVSFLPSSPNLAESTNQGKSLAALTYARMMVPSIQLITFADSSSAPDSRAVADVIRTSGTACLDEWHLPRTKSHVLCRENLQNLVHGRGVMSGRVFENSGQIKLTNPIVTASKALDYPPDLVNRSLMFYLGDLTDAMRADGARLRRLESGSLAMEARLSALAFIEQTGLVNDMHKLIEFATSSVNGLRYASHRLLAQLLYVHRTKQPENGAIDAASVQMRTRFDTHSIDADDSGVLSSLESGSNIRIRLSSLFTDLPELDVHTMSVLLNQKGHMVGTSKHAWASASALIEARLEVASLGTKNYADVVRLTSGSLCRAGNRAVATALIEEIKRRVPLGHAWQLPGPLGAVGWTLVRNNSGSSITVRLEKTAPLPLPP